MGRDRAVAFFGELLEAANLLGNFLLPRARQRQLGPRRFYQVGLVL